MKTKLKNLMHRTCALIVFLRDCSRSPSEIKNIVVKKGLLKEDIINFGAVDTNDVLKLIPGLDVFQSGQKSQQTSIFTRGSESNHTLVLLNGIAINDQSVTANTMVVFDEGQHYFHLQIYQSSLIV